MSDGHEAVVRRIDGKLVLIDPVAHAFMGAIDAHNRAIRKKNCGILRDGYRDRIAHFKRRVSELGYKAGEMAIVIANYDDDNGGALLDIIMPDTDWDAMRTERETPYGRGLVDREVIVRFLSVFDAEASKKLEQAEGTAVVVIDFGVAEIFFA